jgi:hypothetical protein
MFLELSRELAEFFGYLESFTEVDVNERFQRALLGCP